MNKSNNGLFVSRLVVVVLCMVLQNVFCFMSTTTTITTTRNSHYATTRLSRVATASCRHCRIGTSGSSRLQSASLSDTDNNDDDETAMPSLERYWEENSNKWETTLRILDVTAAWQCGSLNGILPSGRESRGAPDKCLISVQRAVELFEEDEQSFLVRRRFRKMKREELRPRWEIVMSKAMQLKKEGQWTRAVEESEKYRAFEKSLVEGTVESADASPAYSRVVATLLSPALGAAARQRNLQDGGYKVAKANLMEGAGTTSEERWITTCLLAELEQEVEALIPTTVVDPQPASSFSSSFSTQEAEKDIQDAGSGALYGILAAIILFNLQQFLTSGF